MKKNNTLKSLYATRRPSGICYLTAWDGLVVFHPAPEDEISHDTGADFVTAWEYDGKRTDFHRNKIHYPASGRAYIRKGKSRRIYLDEILRTDSPWMN